MITKPEDLLNRYVLRSDKEVFEKYMDFCEANGIVWLGGENPRECHVGNAISCCVLFGCRLTWSNDDWYTRKGCTKITMGDFMEPIKTKTEYIKTDKEIWDLKKEFKAGLVYWDDQDYAGLIKADESINLRVLLVHDLYIKTEIEIPWHERLDDFSYPLALVDISFNSISVWDEMMCKRELRRPERLRPATKAEIQVLLDNAPE